MNFYLSLFFYDFAKVLCGKTVILFCLHLIFQESPFCLH
nr:MAG TPA: hypothetical protein [Bacteriophage sp.]